MGVYRRKDSRFYWFWIEGTGKAEKTRIPVDGGTPELTKRNKDLAQKAYAARMGDLAREQYDLPTARPLVTFSAYADWYEAHVSAHKRGHAREQEILKVLRGAFGQELLTAIDRARVLEWRSQRLATVSANTVNREQDLLKHLLASAVPRYLEASPIAGMKRVRVERYEPQPLTRANEAKLLAVLAPDDKAIVLMALDTLMRLGDIINLQRAQDHGRYLTVLTPKTGTTYKVPVSTRLRAALDALEASESPYYFPRRRTDQPRNTMKLMLTYACKRAGLKYGRKHGFTFHVLRHTGASRMVEAGVDLRTVQEIGGWANLRQLSRYTHPTDEAKRKAVETVSGA